MNPIINIARQTYDGPDSASEWLFQMCRLWTEHQSPATGTCLVDYRDPSGPLPFDVTLTTGEDYAYWDAVFALLHDQGLLPDVWSEDDLAKIADDWRRGDVQGYDPACGFPHIRQALHIFQRLDNLEKLDCSRLGSK